MTETKLKSQAMDLQKIISKIEDGGSQVHILLHNEQGSGGDIESGEYTAMDFLITDGNTNNPTNPQARIAMVPGSTADSTPLEASGELIFYTAKGTATNVNTLNEAMRIDEDGRVGIGTSTPSQALHVIGEAIVSGAINTGNLYLTADTTESRFIEIGYGRTGNGYSFIDMRGDATYSDYGLRLLRGVDGPNTNSEIVHRGTGLLKLTTTEGGSVYVSHNLSAASFTDRTPSYDGDAIKEIKKIKNKNGKIDHTTLPSFARVEIEAEKVLSEKKVYKGKGKNRKAIIERDTEKYIEQGRDIGAMVSMLTKATQQMTERIEILEAKVKKLEIKK